MQSGFHTAIDVAGLLAARRWLWHHKAARPAFKMEIVKGMGGGGRGDAALTAFQVRHSSPCLQRVILCQLTELSFFRAPLGLLRLHLGVGSLF